MNPYPIWSEYSSSPEYLAQPITEQNKLALQFFNSNIAPKIGDPQEVRLQRLNFFKNAFPPPPTHGLGDIAKQLAGGVAEGATLGAAKPFEGDLSTIPEALARGAGVMGGGLIPTAATAGVVNPILEAPAAALGGLATDVIPESLSKLIPMAVKGAVTGGALGAEGTEAESHGQAPLSSVAKNTALGAVGGAALEPLMGAYSGLRKLDVPVEDNVPVVGEPTPQNKNLSLPDFIKKQGGINADKSGLFKVTAQDLPQELLSPQSPHDLTTMAQKAFDAGLIPEADESRLVNAVNKPQFQSPSLFPLQDKVSQLPDTLQRMVKRTLNSDATDEGKAELLNHIINTPELADVSPKMSMAEIRKAANALKPGETVPTILNAAGQLNLHDQFAGVGDKLAQVSKEIDNLSQDPNADPAVLNQLKQEYQNLNIKKVQLAEQIKGHSSDTGRALRTLQEAAVARSPQDNFLFNVVKARNDYRISDDEVANLAELYKTDPVAAIKQLAAKMPNNIFTRAEDYFKSNLLNAVVTPLRIMKDNVVNLATDLPVKALAAAFDNAQTGINGEAPHTAFNEVAQRALGNLYGLPEGLSRAVAQIRHGISPYDIDDFNVRANMGNSERPGVGNKVANVLGVPGEIARRLVVAAHLIPRTMAETGEIYSEAMRTARNEFEVGKITKGEISERAAALVKNPTKEMEALERAKGEKAAYQQPLGKLSRSLAEVLHYDMGNLIPALKGFRPGAYPFPFVNIMINRPLEALKWLPTGMVNLAKATPAERSQLTAQMTLGSATAGYFLHKILDGTIQAHGSGPINATKKEYDTWMLKYGGQRNVLIIGHHAINMGHLGTLGLALQGVANIADQIRYGKTYPSKSDSAKVAMNFGASFGDESFLSNISNLMSQIHEMGRGDNATRLVGSLASPIAAGMVPGASTLRTIDHAIDPYVRDTTDHTGLGKDIEAYVKSGIPPIFAERVFGNNAQKLNNEFTSTGLPIRNDVLGNPMLHGNTIEPDEVRYNPMATIMQRAGVEMAYPPSKVGVFEKTALPAQQYENFIKARAQAALPVLNALPAIENEPVNQRLNDEYLAKKELLKRLKPVNKFYARMGDDENAIQNLPPNIVKEVFKNVK